MMTDEIRFLIGVDGGGTNCRAAIASPNLTVLGRAQSGPSNINTDLEGATVNILEAVYGAIQSAGLPAKSVKHSAAFLGLAGAATSDLAQKMSASLPFGLHKVVSDTSIALQGALGDDDGAIAILGTGSAFMSRQSNKQRLIGGWGFNLSDVGGGARLGRHALEMVLLAHDGIAIHSGLTRALFEQFDYNPDNLVLFANAAKPVDYGKFASIIVKHLALGDANAHHLFESSAQFIDAAFDALALGANDQIALLGGLAAQYPPFLAERHRNKLVTPKADALTGALTLARQLMSDAPQNEGGSA